MAVIIADTSLDNKSLTPQDKPVRLVLLSPLYMVKKMEPQRGEVICAGCTTSQKQNWYSNPEPGFLATMRLCFSYTKMTCVEQGKKVTAGSPKHFSEHFHSI